MFKVEWQHIFKTPGLLRIVLGILLIPSFYAVIFLASLWNPYQKINQLPIAIVNQDRPVQQFNQSVATGQQLTKNLIHQKSIDIHQTTATQALQQLNRGHIYAIITIPKSFTHDALRLGSPQSWKADIRYTTSAGHSFVAMKMATTVISNIHSQVSTKLTAGYVQTMGATIKQLERGLRETSGVLSKIMTQMPSNSTALTIQELSLLNTELLKTNQQLHQLALVKNTYRNIAAPIKLVHTDSTTVANNGTGMAPYLMSVALFVGSITLNIIYDTFTPHKRPHNAFQWWGQKAVFLYSFMFLAATTMFLLLLFVNHLAPLNVWLTYLLVLITGTTFLSIVTFFNLWFGKTGAWLMLIFMIIQLGGSAGTYPIQLSNRFFNVIHPFLPMSVSIDAFRQSISIGALPGQEIIILLVIFCTFNLLMLYLFHAKLKKNKEMTTV